MANGALDRWTSPTELNDWVNLTNKLVSTGALTTGNTITQSLIDAATEKAKH